ncbi:WhiB family transcriptional regulator [Streptomyces buecherae]|uniref:WhiB family transcriptional regulator n=1 Tax=Streptomyces buecherae TaxID=2763006 RepID=UPI0036469B03
MSRVISKEARLTAAYDARTNSSPLGWQTAAACQGEDLELFFPRGAGGASTAAQRKALAICARCSVRKQCLSWALENRADFGVYGGMSHKQRREITNRAPGTSPYAPGTVGAPKPPTDEAKPSVVPHCKQGHELTEDNVLMQGKRRRCLTCETAKSQLRAVA